MKRLSTAIAATALLTTAGAVQAQGVGRRALRSDTLQTLGVGAEAVGMGGAFVALSDDLTATFWNPAGLAGIRGQLGADFRTLPKARTDLFSNQRDISATGLQFSYAGAAFEVGGRGGRLAVSRTLAGFEQTNFNPGGGQEIARYWFNSFAYGIGLNDFRGGGSGGSGQASRLRRRGEARVVEVPCGETLPPATPAMPEGETQPKDKKSKRTGKGSEDNGGDDNGDTRPDLRLGLAVHHVELHGAVSSPGRNLRDSGHGVTFGLGLMYLPNGNDGRLRLGLNYLNPTNINVGVVGPTFGGKVAGRVSFGAAYRLAGAYDMPQDRDAARRRRFGIVAAAEGRHYFGTDQNVAEARDSTSDFHFGVRYQYHTGWRASKDTEKPNTGTYRDIWFLRQGFYTRNSSNEFLFFDDRVFTLGFGYERVNDYRVDVALEASAVSGDPRVITSFRYLFGGTGQGR